jgi:hypothetical protein
MIRFVLALFGAFAFSAPAAAQSAQSNACLDNGSDACQAERVVAARTLYDLPPIEQLLAEGVQVRRAFFVDGHYYVGVFGPDLGVVSFTRAPGGAPTVTFQLPFDGVHRHAPLVAAVPAPVWAEALAGAEGFDRPVPPLPELALCFHVAEYNVEAADPAAAGRPASFRRRYDNRCTEQSPTIDYAERLMALAAGLFPECAPLRVDLYEQSIRYLRDCARLSGDRRAAAAAFVAMAVLRPISDSTGLDQLAAVFAPQARLDYQGGSVTGAVAVAERWRREVGRRRWLLRWDRIEGVSAERVEAGGLLIDGEREADVSVLWTRVGEGRFTAERATIGAFRQRRP